MNKELYVKLGYVIQAYCRNKNHEGEVCEITSSDGNGFDLVCPKCHRKFGVYVGEP